MSKYEKGRNVRKYASRRAMVWDYIISVAAVVGFALVLLIIIEAFNWAFMPFRGCTV